jgi:hypothetical protein
MFSDLKIVNGLLGTFLFVILLNSLEVHGLAVSIANQVNHQDQVF